MNEKIKLYLKELEKTAKNHGEIYRERSFRKARLTVSGLNYELNNANQLKGKPGIGKGILERISEILSTGRLKEVDESSITEKDKIIENFKNIQGVGEKTAQRWYENGYRNLKDIIKNVKLTNAQKIGIKYYDELKEKIPRKSIEKIEIILQETVKQINKEFKIKLICVIAGSFRRKLNESGDIDCLIAIENGKLTNDEIDYFMSQLIEKGLITDDLGRGESKYSGICVDENGVHRRIDFEFVHDYTSFPYELLYFTGGQQFNLEMRHKAKEQGKILNQTGLYGNGKFISAKSEKEIFKNIGMMYLKPEERY